MSKCQVEGAMYIPFILISSIIVIVVFAYLPTNALDETIQVSSLDGVLMNARFKNKVSYVDPLTLRVYPMTLKSKNDFKYNLSNYFIFSGKNVAYKLSFNGKENFYDEDLFIRASSAVPFGDYNKINFKKNIDCLQGNCGKVKFEQILPKVYYVK